MSRKQKIRDYKITFNKRSIYLTLRISFNNSNGYTNTRNTEIRGQKMSKTPFSLFSHSLIPIIDSSL